MSSASMPPPPSPLAHRRNRLNTTLTTTDLTSCGPRKMSLLKGATFHSSSSPASDVDPVLSIQYLSRRSPTCSHASLSNLLSEKRGLAAHAIADFEETFSGARGSNQTSRRRSLEAFNQQLKAVRAALPTDEGIGSSVSSPSEKGISKSLARVELDSGLGDSIDGSVIVDPVLIQHNSEEDSSAARNLIQDTDHSDNTNTQSRHPGRNLRQRTTASKPRASSTSHTQSTNTHPSLSRFAKKKISEILFTPLLTDERFKEFRPLVTQIGSRVNKNLRCLRDLERSLIFHPVVSLLYPLVEFGSNTSIKTQVPIVTPRLYQSFGELTIQLVVDTYNHLSETEQRRSSDRPYSNGYFLDLVQQVNQLAAHIGSSSRSQETEESEEEVFSIEDEVTLEGGLGNTGDFAELVRWKNGKGISLRTGLPYEPMTGLKRQHSTMTDEEIARSMARRKKGYIPEYIEMECSDPECDKKFTRKCDLAKHEKTHSRPFKCPHKSCKYHELGLPTEKEKERHMNDKHDPNPRLYPCMFCEFKTKRESNCKQHMEKKHNWEYKRAKGKDKDVGSTPSHTPHTSTMDYNPSVVQPSPAVSTYNWDDHSSVSGSLVESAHGSTHFTPLDEPMPAFDNFNTGFQNMPLFPRQPQQGTSYVQASDNFAFEVPTHNLGHNQFNGYISPVKTTPDSAHMRLTPATPAYSTFTPQEQSPYLDNHMNFGGQGLSGNMFCQDSLPTPDSVSYPYSRHESIHFDSPHSAQQAMNSGLMMGHDIQLPVDDFALNLNAFSNPAAADQVLFDEKDIASQQFDASTFDGYDFSNMEDLEMNDFDDMINYNGN